MRPPPRRSWPPGREPPRPGALAELLLDHVTPTVRPGDVLTALHEQAGLDTPRPPLVTRLAQGRLDADGALDDPLDHAAS